MFLLFLKKSSLISWEIDYILVYICIKSVQIKLYEIRRWLIQNTHMKWYVVYRIVPFLVTLNDLRVVRLFQVFSNASSGIELARFQPTERIARSLGIAEPLQAVIFRCFEPEERECARLPLESWTLTETIDLWVAFVLREQGYGICDTRIARRDGIK